MPGAASKDSCSASTCPQAKRCQVRKQMREQLCHLRSTSFSQRHGEKGVVEIPGPQELEWCSVSLPTPLDSVSLTM